MLLVFMHDGNSNNDLGSQQKLCDLEIGIYSFRILRMCSTISRLGKFLDRANIYAVTVKEVKWQLNLP